MMAASPVVSEAYDLVLWLRKAIARFPRSERYGIGLRIENKALDILDNLVRACYSKEKKQYLREVNLQLEELRFLIRLCRDYGHLTEKRYEFASSSVLAVGRQVGGWLKSRGEHSESV